MLTLFAIAAATVAAPPVYRAGGTEPFWSLTIDGQRVRIEEPERRPLVLTGVVRRPSPIGTRYISRAIAITIVPQPCSDGMSDRRYPDTVTVRMGRRTLRGCGGTSAPTAAMLEGSRWTIATIDGRPPAPGTRTEFAFDRERMSGNAGCNRFSGGYRIERERLVTGPLASTRMACIGAAMGQEQRVFAILERPMRITTDAENRVILTNGLGTIALTRR